MAIEIREVKTEEEYHAVEELQREIWGGDEIEIVGFGILMTAHKNGGVMLGAFDTTEGQERMIGFVFGFVGLTPDGQVKHCSHIAGIHPEYRDRKVGYALKLKQRECVLAQGIELITWTFDPLESRNARFNFHKLGVSCGVYFRNLYGAMRDNLNADLPTDRFQVDWRITSPRVEACLRGDSGDKQSTSFGSFGGSGELVVRSGIIDGIPLLNPPVAPHGDDLLSRPLTKASEELAAVSAEQALIRIPSNFQRLKVVDKGLALEWRLHTRELFEWAFANGYRAIDLLVDDGWSYYLLEKAGDQ